MLSPPKTATPFDNGLDGRDASQDIDSSFNFPEIPLGSEPSSKDENPDENVEVVDSDDSLPGVFFKNYLEFDWHFLNDYFHVFLR